MSCGTGPGQHVETGGTEYAKGSFLLRDLPLTASQPTNMAVPAGASPSSPPERPNDHTSGYYKRMVDDPRRIPSPEMVNRSSFSSIRENDSDLAQSFSYSRISSYINLQNEQAIDDTPSPSPSPPAMATMVQTEFLPPLTRPNSKLHGYWYPPDSFKGWKQINVRGKLASKSFGDLQSLNLTWKDGITRKQTKRDGVYAPGTAPIERLPVELLSKLI